MGLEGTVVSIAGVDFVTIATASLFSDCSQLRMLTPRTVLGTVGSFTEIDDQNQLMRPYLKNPLGHMMTTDIWRHKISNVVFTMRTMPHSVQNVLVGLDNNSKGCIYQYNHIGKSYPVPYLAIGYGHRKLRAALENLMEWENVGEANSSITKDWATDAVLQIFHSVSDNFNFGNSLSIKIVTRRGIEEEEEQLNNA